MSAMLSDYTHRHNTAYTTQVAAGANKLDVKGLVRALRSVDVNSTSIVDQLGRITAPTLMIAGSDDHVFPSPHTKTVVAEVSNFLVG
jgi:pimeloyl-ACP methyl ester carboxylesterase